MSGFNLFFPRLGRYIIIACRATEGSLYVVYNYILLLIIPCVNIEDSISSIFEFSI